MWSMTNRVDVQLAIARPGSRIQSGRAHPSPRHVSLLVSLPLYCPSGLPVAAATARNRVRGLHYVPARWGLARAEGSCAPGGLPPPVCGYIPLEPKRLW